MNSGSFNLKTFSHNLGQNWYHVVLIPKYRYPVFKNSYQNYLCNEAIDLVCKKHLIDLYAKEVMDDHVHLFISCPQDYSIRKLIQVLKGGISYHIRKCQPALKKYKTLWSRGFMYRSVGSVSADKIKEYIEKSNRWMGNQQKLI